MLLCCYGGGPFFVNRELPYITVRNLALASVHHAEGTTAPYQIRNIRPSVLIPPAAKKPRARSQAVQSTIQARFLPGGRTFNCLCPASDCCLLLAALLRILKLESMTSRPQHHHSAASSIERSTRSGLECI